LFGLEEGEDGGGGGRWGRWGRVDESVDVGEEGLQWKRGK